MKTTLKLIFTILLLLRMQASFSAVITPVINNGDWADVSTWDLGRIPEDLDVVTIPDGMTVFISTNLYHSVPRQPDLTINVYGILQLIGTGQINIGCGSKICVFGSGSIPATGCNCNQINLGAGGAEWKGMHDGTLTAGQCLTGSCFLPVTLLSFSASLAEGKTLLSWTSSEELNFQHYILERSVDGVLFEAIGTISAKNEGVHKEYSFTDQFYNEASVYFRLKMVDLDASFTYSRVIVFQNQLDGSLSFYPNPVATGESINLTVNSEVEVIIKDLNGMKYFQQFIFTESPIQTISIPVNLPSGVYLLQVSQADYTSSSKLVVK